MKKKPLKRKYAKISEDDETGIIADSIVEEPAIMVDFVALQEEQKPVLKFSVDAPKQILVGPLLIPDVEILRKDSNGEYYNLIFTTEEIRKINRKRQSLKKNNNLNLDHNSNQAIDAINEEFWIIEDPKNDKANALGFELPAGTLMTQVYIPDLELFNKIKDNFNGFSIEGYFDVVDAEEIQQSEIELEVYNDYPQAVSDAAARGIRLNEAVNNRCATQVGKVRAQQLANRENISFDTVQRMYSYLSRAKEYYNPSDTEACGTISYLLWGGEPALRWSERIINQKNNKEKMEKNLFKSILDLFTKKTIQINFSEVTLKDGTVVMIDDETMIATIEGELAPAGEHELSDGSIIVVDENGVIIEIKKPEEEKEPEIEVEVNAEVEEVKFMTWKLEDGREIKIHGDNTVTIDGETAPDGDYMVTNPDDSNDIRVLQVKDGKVLELIDANLAKITELENIISELKSELDSLKKDKSLLASQFEQFKKTRAVAAPEILPVASKTNQVATKKSDLMVQKLQQLLDKK